MVRGLVAKEVAECKLFGVDLCYQVFYILFVWYQVNNWALKHQIQYISRISKSTTQLRCCLTGNLMAERGRLSGLGISSTGTVQKYINTNTRRLHVDICVENNVDIVRGTARASRPQTYDYYIRMCLSKNTYT